MNHHVCQEKDCKSTDTVECRLTVYKNDIYKPSLFGFIQSYGFRDGIRNIYEILKYGYTDTFDYYCPNHCKKNGYCYGCGNFWAGVEQFDFGNGLCDNCQSDLGEDDYEEDQYYYGDTDYWYDEHDYYNYNNQEYYPDEEYPE